MTHEADLHIREQAIAEIIGSLNEERIHDLCQKIHTQDEAFKLALDELKKVSDFINAPEHILGRADTKHGEVAEQLEVGVRRAYDALNQMSFSATFEGVGRTAPEDYKINGLDVQSKFINGARNTMDHVSEHLNKYPWWGEQNQIYHVPKDQYAQLEMVYRGITPEGLSDNSAQNLREKIQSIIDRTGKPFNEIICPSTFEYKEVQLGVASDTLGGVEKNITTEQEAKVREIEAVHQPSLSDAVEGAAVAGAFAAALDLGYGLYKKYKAGQSIFELTADDWKELGLSSAKSGVGGSATAFLIYGLTNFSNMPAPLAGAIASTARGIYTQVDLYRAGKLTKGQLIDNSMALGSEAGIVALCSAGGQLLIPIPILGGVIGSITGKFVSKILMDYMNKAGKELVDEISRRTDEAIQKLDDCQKRIIAKLVAEFNALDDLMTKAFDPQVNAQLVGLSIALALSTGVPEEIVLKSRDDLDRYMCC